jgi:hypothetical protein
MYYHKESNKYIPENQQFTLGDIEYSASWLAQISPEQITEMGLEPVVVEGGKKDAQFYWNGESYEGAVIRITNTPRDLDQVKSVQTQQIKTEAFNILQPSDYIDTRNLRDPEYKPEWVEWRDQIRAYATNTIENISLAEDVDSVKFIIDGLAWPKDPNYVAPVESPEGEVVDVPT